MTLREKLWVSERQNAEIDLKLGFARDALTRVVAKWEGCDSYDHVCRMDAVVLGAKRVLRGEPFDAPEAPEVLGLPPGLVIEFVVGGARIHCRVEKNLAGERLHVTTSDGVLAASPRAANSMWLRAEDLR